jgi:DNA-binding transcriptional regulator/RsmH inhibitor MraZ
MAEWKGVQMPKFSGYDEEKTEERVELLARLAYCFDVETDSAARLLIPKPLMEYVGLGPGQECVLTSGGTYLKLMRAKAFDDLVRPILKAYGGSANDEPTKNAER